MQIEKIPAMSKIFMKEIKFEAVAMGRKSNPALFIALWTWSGSIFERLSGRLAHVGLSSYPMHTLSKPKEIFFGKFAGIEVSIVPTALVTLLAAEAVALRNWLSMLGSAVARSSVGTAVVIPPAMLFAAWKTSRC